MDSGIISLKPLYDFVRSQSDDQGLAGTSNSGRQYSKIAGAVVSTIAARQGFYLWGAYDGRGVWSNLYLGKAGFGKTAHLRTRILEELKDERCCFWMESLTHAGLMSAGGRHYQNMWHRYERHWLRSILKAGSTHVAWVADEELSNEAVGNIESDLIETLNPKANKSRPVPLELWQAHTGGVIALFRQAIHQGRASKYLVTVLEGE